jgi:lipoprotein NlpD
LFPRPEGLTAARSAAVLALVLAGGCATLRTPSPPPETLRGAWYVVEPGDTLASIANRHGIPLEDLAEVNGFKRGDRIAPGRVIFLLAKEPSPPPAPAAHLVLASSAPRPPLSLQQKASAPGMRWPLDAPRPSSLFGTREGHAHEGIDLAAPLGTPIHAAEGGQVLYAGNAVRGYGNMVVLQHPGDLVTVYAHTSVLLVRTGDKISAGQEIARVGQSGRATGPHLHFEVRRGQVPQDPLRYLPPAPLASGGEKQ